MQRRARRSTAPKTKIMACEYIRVPGLLGMLAQTETPP
jgi:hypothetical protein